MLKKIKKIILSTSFALLFLASKVEALDWCSNATYTECGSCESLWGSAEYLYWDVQGAPRVPALVTQQAINSTDTSYCTLIGDEKLNSKWRSGAKFSLGYWFDSEHSLGGELVYFVLPKKSKSRSVCSSLNDGYSLNVPYYDAVTGAEAFSDLAYAGVYLGSAKLKQANDMQGAELNAWMSLPAACDYKAGWLVGFRYWNFDEHLKFTTAGNFATRDTHVWETSDKFRVINNFYGGQIGFGAETAYDQFYVNGKFKLALGALCGESKVRGSVYTNEYNDAAYEGDPIVFEGGYFAVPSTNGHHKKTRFAVIPEINLNIGYQFNDCCRVQVGYSFFYINEVLRASKQLKNKVNPNESIAFQTLDYNSDVALCRSAHALKTSSLWAQGLNVGVEFQF